MDEGTLYALIMIGNYGLELVSIIAIIYLAGSFKKLLKTKEYYIRYKMKDNMTDKAIFDAILYAETSDKKDKVSTAKDYFFSNAHEEIIVQARLRKSFVQWPRLAKRHVAHD